MPTDRQWPCPTCEGDGRAANVLGFPSPCPACNGSGVERMVPEAALRAWIKEQRERSVLGPLSTGYRDAVYDLSVFLDSLHAEPGTDRSEG